MWGHERITALAMALLLFIAAALASTGAAAQQRQQATLRPAPSPLAAEIVLQPVGSGPTVRLQAPSLPPPMSPPFPPESYRLHAEQPRSAVPPPPPATRPAFESDRSAAPVVRQDREEGPSTSDIDPVQARILALQAELERLQAAQQADERDDLAALPPSSEAEPSPIARPELRTPETAAPPRSARPRITEHPPRRMWVRSNARVRAGPSTEDAQVASLSAGTEVEVLGSIDDGEWYWLGRDGVGFGYIAGFLLTTDPPAAPRTAAPSPPPPGAPVGVRPDRHGACPAGTVRLRLGDGSPICARFN